MTLITKPPTTLREKVIFALSLLLFAVLNLVPGLTGSFADAQYGGGGGGGCPGTTCSGSGKVCCAAISQVCTGNPPVCHQQTIYYFMPEP